MDQASREAFVTLATNDTYCKGAYVLAKSLRNNNTKKEIIVMVTPHVSASARLLLKSVFDRLIHVDVMDSGDAAHLAMLKRPELGITFTKLHCWSLTEYDKCVFMDADTMVLTNIDDLLEKEELSAAPDAGWPDMFNSGVFVYRPSMSTYLALISLAEAEGSFDGGDQGLLNTYFNNWATGDISKHLSFLYNMHSTSTYTYSPAFARFGHDTKVVHFIGSVKPWHHTYYPSTDTLQQADGSGIHEERFLKQWWRLYMHAQVAPSSSTSRGASWAGPSKQAKQQTTQWMWKPAQVDYKVENFQPKKDEVPHITPAPPFQYTPTVNDHPPSSASQTMKHVPPVTSEVMKHAPPPTHQAMEHVSPPTPQAMEHVSPPTPEAMEHVSPPTPQTMDISTPSTLEVIEPEPHQLSPKVFDSAASEWTVTSHAGEAGESSEREDVSVVGKPEAELKAERFEMWRRGITDYLGADSFVKIQARIDKILNEKDETAELEMKTTGADLTDDVEVSKENGAITTMEEAEVDAGIKKEEVRIDETLNEKNETAELEMKLAGADLTDDVKVLKENGAITTMEEAEVDAGIKKEEAKINKILSRKEENADNVMVILGADLTDDVKVAKENGAEKATVDAEVRAVSKTDKLTSTMQDRPGFESRVGPHSEAAKHETKDLSGMSKMVIVGDDQRIAVKDEDVGVVKDTEVEKKVPFTPSDAR